MGLRSAWPWAGLCRLCPFPSVSRAALSGFRPGDCGLGQDWQQRPGSEVGGGMLTTGRGVSTRGRQAGRSEPGHLAWARKAAERLPLRNEAGKLLGCPRHRGSGSPAGPLVRVSVAPRASYCVALLPGL